MSEDKPKQNEFLIGRLMEIERALYLGERSYKCIQDTATEALLAVGVVQDFGVNTEVRPRDRLTELQADLDMEKVYNIEKLEVMGEQVKIIDQLKVDNERLVLQLDQERES
jgi:hypothetical protein